MAWSYSICVCADDQSYRSPYTHAGLLVLILSVLLCCSKNEAVSNKRGKRHFCKDDFKLGSLKSSSSKCRHSNLQLCTRWGQMDTRGWPAILRLLAPAVFTSCGFRCPGLGFVSTTEENSGFPSLSECSPLWARTGMKLGSGFVLIYAVLAGSWLIHTFSPSVLWKSLAGLSQLLWECIFNCHIG